MSATTPEPSPAAAPSARSALGNIGPRGQRQRNWMGLLTLLLAIALGAVFVWQEVNPLLRCVLFVPFFFGYLGLFQAKAKTCVFLVAKGQCELDSGRQPVTDPLLRAELSRRANWIYIKTTVAAFLWTALFFFYEKDWWRSLQDAPPQQPAVVVGSKPAPTPSATVGQPTSTPTQVSP
jgi:hypothetical protein